MSTALQKGQKLESGFEILEVKDLAEFEATGIWARHKSGAQVFHVVNDDEENLFSFNFATYPEDSTGVAHILEHSVLCGSENYPLKDAFLILAQGSLQTFLNAMTFPDKTLYPASSVNEHDYFNLMGVYGDAVFRPLISEWTFMQEGHRLEFQVQDKNQGLDITGVVYNEMKGAYSSADAYAGLWSFKSVLPGTTYDFESGGDPDHIPDLTWEQLKEFHRIRYSPANCRVFLAGNIPTEKQLAFLDERFFSSLPSGSPIGIVSKAAPWKEPRSFTIPCPAGSDPKPQVMLSWLCGDTADLDETLALAALTEALLCHDGSPLTRTLIDSGLGEDLSPVTGFQLDLRETIFSAGLRGVKQNKEKEVEALILKELKRFADEGIPKEEIEAALLGMEFSQKEIRRSGGPFSLVWMIRSMRNWLHGGKPWDSLVFAPKFEELKLKLQKDGRYFEKLIQKYLLDNPHRAFVVIKPEKDFLEKKEALLAKKLAEKEAALSNDDKENIRKKAAELAKIQETADSPEALAKIPHLSRKDLSTEIEKVPREFNEAQGIPVLTHSLFTNGISYADFAFPLDVLDKDDYFWVPFFSRTVVSLGLPGTGSEAALDYGEVSSLLARTAGAFYAGAHTSSSAPGSAKTSVFPSGTFDTGGRDWLMYHVKALDEKMEPSLDLALRLITEADFTDLKRLKDLAAEMKNDLDSGLAPGGHRNAESRAGRHFSRSRYVTDMWGGLQQLYFVHRLVELDAAEISRKLCSIRDKLVKGGLIANLGGNAAAIAKGLDAIGSRFSNIGALKPRRNGGDAISFQAEDSAAAEVFASPSLQIGFAALSLPAADFGSDEQAAEAVLSHQLTTGPLWEKIRMKGGAYGAFAHPDNMEGVFCFSSYSDPSPSKSLETFSSIVKDMAKAHLDNPDELEKAIIGTYSKETRPRTPSEKCFADFLRFLYGVEDRHRAAKLEKLIGLTPGDITSILERLADEGQKQGSTIISGRAEAEKAAAALGVELQELPV